MGYFALQNSPGSHNSAVGHYSLYQTTGSYNFAGGYYAGEKLNAGWSNVYLGPFSGPANYTSESNKLYIANAPGTPLIGGDFLAKTVTIDGVLTANGSGLTNIPYTALDEAARTSITNAATGGSVPAGILTNNHVSAVTFSNDVTVDGVLTTDGAVTVRSNSWTTPPTLSPGDISFLSQEGVPMVRSKSASGVERTNEIAAAFTNAAVLYVDPNGNDATAQRGRADKVFATLEAAEAVAVSGDVIHVAPGSYSLTNSLGKDGVDWWFAPSAVVTGSYKVFHADAMSFGVYGKGEFYQTEDHGAVNAAALWMDNDSTVVFECKTLSAAGAGAAAVSVEYSTSQSLTVRCDLLNSSAYDAVVWIADDGLLDLEARTVTCAHQVLEVNETSSAMPMRMRLGRVVVSGTQTALYTQSAPKCDIVVESLTVTNSTEGLLGTSALQCAGNHVFELRSVVGAGDLWMGSQGRLRNSRISTDGSIIVNSSTVPLTLENVVFDTTADYSITSAVPHTVNVVGTLTLNKPVHSNVTIAGGVVVYTNTVVSNLVVQGSSTFGTLNVGELNVTNLAASIIDSTNIINGTITSNDIAPGTIGTNLLSQSAYNALVGGGSGVSNGVVGITTNVAVLVPGDLTNTLQFYLGVLTNVVAGVVTNEEPEVGDYTAYATKFGTTTDVLSKVGAFTDLADGTNGVLSFWVKWTGAVGDLRKVFYSTGGDMYVQKLDNECLRVGFSDTSEIASTILTSTNAITTNEWHHIAATWDSFDASKCRMWIDAVECGSITTRVATNLDYTLSAYFVSYDDATGVDGELCEFWMGFNQFLDLGESSNLQKFRSTGGKPVDLGEDGSTPTGTSPTVYLRHPYTGFQTNAGTGGDFSVSGTLEEGTPP